MSDDPADYIKKVIQKVEDPIIRAKCLRMKKEIDESMARYQAELDRLKDYSKQEGFDSTFEKQLVDIAFGGSTIGWRRGSFMEWAQPQLELIEKAIGSFEDRTKDIDSLPGSAQIVDIEMVKEFVNLLKSQLEKFNDTPLVELRNHNKGKEMLAKLWSDIETFNRYLSDLDL